MRDPENEVDTEFELELDLHADSITFGLSLHSWRDYDYGALVELRISPRGFAATHSRPRRSRDS